ncbi:hypothetical protein [Aliivibrio fischeri]|uniref:Uncharacterized protein n=1 Tax=Aliivibrio fischeri (strain MJ11) TaxID=388396 RepID=B5EW34_ALIFM|nr:hypothetical protein [Aliivibrio fischeri]ACH64673.1 hypothetical protein VFMJ11_B0091 [Aliivibrio fischeri MJ11]
MIDFEGRVNEIATSLYNENLTNSVDIKRVTFDIYITMLKQGFLCSESLTNEKLLSHVPYEYYPCNSHLVGSFYMTPAMLRIISKKYESYIKINISEEDKKEIVILSKMLPLTHEQANLYLLNNNVISNEIAPEGIQYLINNFSNISCKPVLLSIYPIDANAKVERAKRNTKPSIYYLLPDVINKTKFNTHLESIKRQVARQESYIGFSILSSICDSFPFKFNGKNILTTDFVRSILSSRPEFKLIDDISCISQDVSNSEFSSLLKQYINHVGTISHSDAYAFFLRYFEYKKFKQGGYSKNNDFGKTTKTKRDEKLQFSDIVDNVVIDYLFNVEDVIYILSNIDGFVIGDNSIDFDGIDSSIHGVNESAWDAFFLSFCKKIREEKSSYTISLSDAQDYSIEYLNNRFDFYLNNENGFFSNKDKVCSVGQENIHYVNNRNSAYLKPDIDELNDMLGSKYVLLDEIKQKASSNHEVYSEVFSEKWKKVESKNKVDPDYLFTNDEYVNDLEMLYTKSFYTNSLSQIEQQISFSEKRIAESEKRRVFIQSFSHSEPSSKELNSSLSKLDEREFYAKNKIDQLKKIKKAVFTSESYIEWTKLLLEIEDIKSRKKLLRINPIELKAGLLIHEKIIQEGGDMLISDIKIWIDDVVRRSSSNGDGDGLLWKYVRSNLSRYISHPYHPFGLSELS